MTTKRSDIVRFTPEKGLTVGTTIKEEIHKLLDDGYFDDAESIVVGVSNKEAYDARWAGQKFDCWGLLGALKEKLDK